VPADHTRRFPRGAVASPHHLASAAGAAVLRAGGNAIDAAVATNLVLGVVAPYFCGPGGDLFALVVDPEGRTHALDSAGRTPAAATVDQVRAAAEASTVPVGASGAGGMPELGALTVTVPGAVAGWHALLERFGTRSFGDLAGEAVRLATDGFPVSVHAGGALARSRERYAGHPSWQDAFGHLGAGDWWVQPGHAAFLRALADGGPGALYGGTLGEELVEALAAGGSAMTLDDLRAHRVADVEPLTTTFGPWEVVELPPPTQGVAAVTALGVAQRLLAAGAPDPGGDPAATAHLDVEAVRLALVDRAAHLADPARMRTTPAALTDPARLDALAATVDPERAAAHPPATPTPGGTAYLCAADADGWAISLIQSNYLGFGSGVVLPRSGVTLHNRGAQLSLDPDHVNVLAGGVQPPHTLIPAMLRRDGACEVVFGTMGGDGQAQTHLQVLRRLARGADLQEAIAGPRWVVSPADGSVTVEDRVGDAIVDGLRARGHTVHVVGGYEGLLGHAHAIRLERPGFAAASDPRAEGAAAGW
jgi:gamma-glutamyltranspeptidase / glutathione hydrolase